MGALVNRILLVGWLVGWLVGCGKKRSAAEGGSGKENGGQQQDISLHLCTSYAGVYSRTSRVQQVYFETQENDLQ